MVIGSLFISTSSISPQEENVSFSFSSVIYSSMVSQMLEMYTLRDVLVVLCPVSLGFRLFLYLPDKIKSILVSRSSPVFLGCRRQHYYFITADLDSRVFDCLGH